MYRGIKHIHTAVQQPLISRLQLPRVSLIPTNHSSPQRPTGTLGLQARSEMVQAPPSYFFPLPESCRDARVGRPPGWQPVPASERREVQFLPPWPQTAGMFGGAPCSPVLDNVSGDGPGTLVSLPVGQLVVPWAQTPRTQETPQDLGPSSATLGGDP